MKTALAILLIVIIIAAGVWLVSFYTTRPEPGETVRHMKPLACASCGRAFAMEAGVDPVECLYCKEKNAWRAQKCATCGAIFPMIADDAGDAGIRCTQCGSASFGEVPPDAIEIP